MPVRRRCAAFVLFSCLVSVSGCLAGNTAPEPKNLLEDSLPPRSFTEYLDLIGFSGKSHQEKLTNGLRVRYAGQRVNLIACFSLLWGLYKWRIVLVFAFCLIETALILGLLAQRTRRRRADLALQQLNGQLIHAQEEERARIARELHDDIGQQIVAIGLGLHMLEAQLTGAPPKALEQVSKIEDRIHTLTGSIRHLSHELHPAVLEYAGLPAALRTHCAEFRELTGISVNLGFQPDPLTLPRDVSLCLYRISQECLRNTSKHSGAHYVRLHVKANKNVVELVITDDGHGFDVEAAAAHHGLGLKSMEERVRLLNGTLHVNSRPRWGTVLKARIPLTGQVVAG